MQLAGKCKRLCLTLGGHAGPSRHRVAGTVWLRGTRICSATTAKPAYAQEAGAGWINLKAIASGLMQTNGASFARHYAEAWNRQRAAENMGTFWLKCCTLAREACDAPRALGSEVTG